MKYGILLYKRKPSEAWLEYKQRGLSDPRVDGKREYGYGGKLNEDEMENFDTAAVVECLRERLTADGRSLCKLNVEHTSVLGICYIYLVTSYEESRTVLAELCGIMCRFGLSAYDTELEKICPFAPEYRDGYVNMRLRAKTFTALFREKARPIWRIRELDRNSGGDLCTCAYVVTLLKNRACSIEIRAREIHKLLRNNLIWGERLDLRRGCFTVHGQGYSITYCVEGYKRHADRTVRIEGVIGIATLLRRMPCEAAWNRYLELSEWEKRDTRYRMRFNEWIMRYPNPADRFVRSLEVTLQLKKERFGIQYGRVEPESSFVLFHAVQNPYLPEDDDSFSALKLEDGAASFILPLVETVYPYIYGRYGQRNHIPCEMMVDIVESIKAIRTELAVAENADCVKDFISRFNLFELAERTGCADIDGYFSEEDVELIRSDPSALVFKHRYRIVRLYDIFVSWAETQIECYGHESVFNIEGV